MNGNINTCVWRHGCQVSVNDIWVSYIVCVYNFMCMCIHLCQCIYQQKYQSCSFLYYQITPDEHISIEEVMSQRSHDHLGEERRGKREGDALVRLRTENELTPPVSVSYYYIIIT